MNKEFVTPKDFCIPVMEIASYETFKYNGKVYESRSKQPTKIGPFVFLTAWDTTQPRGERTELRFNSSERVYLTGYWIDGEGKDRME